MTTIYFATNRNPNNATNPTNFGAEFSSNGLGDLRFGRARLKDGKFDAKGIELLPDDPKTGSEALLKQLRTDMKTDKTDTLIFIHGFNVSFTDAIESAGAMQARYSKLSQGNYTPNIFVFSWPSDGRTTSYMNDRHDAEASGYAFARGLMKLATFLKTTTARNACNQKTNLIAHSMGNYVLRHAIQQAKKISNAASLSRMFDDVILAAADEDNDAFEHEHKLARLPDLAQRVTVYFNNGDLALKVSDYTKGNPDRLGHDGPNKPHDVPAKVVLVDASKVVSGASSEKFHSYFYSNDNVGRDVIAILQGESSESSALSRVYVPHANKFRLI